MLLQFVFVFLTIGLLTILFAELFIAKHVMSYYEEEESVDNFFQDIVVKNETILFYISHNNTILMDYREMDKDDTNHIHNIKQNFFIYE